MRPLCFHAGYAAKEMGVDTAPIEARHVLDA